MSEATIAAIATPHAPGGISAVRISGVDAASIASAVFAPSYPHNTVVAEMAGYTACYGVIHDGADGAKIDDGVLLVFRSPHSYTGEDTAEFYCHGGVCVTRRVLETVIKAGAFPARAGEFTERAFLNGKMSLSQAEAVAEIIGAGGAVALKTFEAQKSGALYRRVAEIAENVAAVAAEISAYTDYPDEVDPPDAENLTARVRKSLHELRELENSYNLGSVIKSGVRAVFAGKPNAGKSSLMNALAGRERSIVSVYAGTTRDIVEDCIDVGGVVLNLSDCAGLRGTADEVEQAGVARAKAAIETAELVLCVFDGSRGLSNDDFELIRLTAAAGKNCVCVVNKSDLPRVADIDVLRENYSRLVFTSAVRDHADGLSQLRKVICDACGVNGGDVEVTAAPLTNERQLGCVARARDALEMAENALRLCNFDAAGVAAQASLNALWEIEGKNAAEEVISKVFETFCVGK